jgi:hypothetical protein
LCHEFADIEFKDGESVDEFSLRSTTLADNLQMLGDSVRESEVVKKLLQVVPEYLEQAEVTCEMILDLNATSVEEVTSCLHVFECRRNNNNSHTDAMGWLMLMEDEWRAQVQQRLVFLLWQVKQSPWQAARPRRRRQRRRRKLRRLKGWQQFGLGHLQRRVQGLRQERPLGQRLL